MCTFVGALHHYIGILSSLWALSWAFSNVIWAAAFTYYIYLDASWCPKCVCLSSFWAFPTGIWAIPCKKWHKYTCSLVEVLHHYIDIWAHFELCLGFFPMWFELLPLHTTYTLVSYTCSFEPILSLVLSFPPVEFELSHAQKKHTQQKNIKHMCAFVGVLHHYIGIWARFELCLELFPVWFELLPLHTTYTLMHLDVLYVFVWDHVELDFELSPQEFELSHTQQDMHKHMCTFVGVLHHYIGIWAHFELCLELFPMWFELLPLHTTYTLMHLDVLYVFVWDHVELDFELSPLEFELSHAQKTYINICVPLLVFSLHRYLSSPWALSWAFSNVIWAAAFTYYIYLGVLYVFIWTHFELDFELVPLEWAIPCRKKT